MPNMAQQPQQIDPRLLHEAQHDPQLDYMIRNGIPLNRKLWISMAYLGHPPEPWTAEHEAELPTPFQHNPPEVVDN